MGYNTSLRSYRIIDISVVAQAETYTWGISVDNVTISRSFDVLKEGLLNDRN